MKQKNFFVTVVLIIIAGAAITSIVSIGMLSDNESKTSNYNGTPKAAILDQLSEDIPNEFFREKASEYLNASGYEVDIFSTKDITVDFFKELPSMNYQFVIIRTHGVLDAIEKTPMLFTGEKYTEEEYITEQLLGHVKKSHPFIRSCIQT